MSPEEIRNTLDDDADLSRSDMTLWRDRGQIIAAQQTRIAQLEARISRVEELARDDSKHLVRWIDGSHLIDLSDIREALT